MRTTFLSGLSAAVLSIVLAASTTAAVAENPTSRTSQLQDLELVRTDYLPKEMAYTPRTRHSAEALIRRLEARAGRLTPTDMLVGLAEVGALTDNAHSGVRYHDPKVVPAARLPLRLLWLPGGMIVARATGRAEDLAGARVLGVEGRSPAALYQRIKGLEGGKAADRMKYLPELIERQGVLHAMGLAARPDRLALTLRLPSGRVTTRTVAMVPTADTTPTASSPDRLWSPEPVAGETAWRAALRVDREPLYLRDADQPFRIEPVGEGRALYIQFRTNSDDLDHPIAAFLKTAQDRIAADRPQNLVLDLRFDIGGNLTTTLAFMRALPPAIPGRIFLLTGPYTFSAGIISAAAVKQAGGDKVTVIGEDVGDRPHFWSEGDLIKLPNSHLAMRYTDGQFDLDHGCIGKPGCMDRLVNVDFVPLKPATPAPLTLDAYEAGRDPAMEAVTAELSRGGGHG